MNLNFVLVAFLLFISLLLSSHMASVADIDK